MEYIDKAYKCGEELGKTRDEVMLRICCGLMEIYMFHNMAEKAFEALDCMARKSSVWVNLREDIVKWSASNGKIYILLGHLKQRLDEFSIPLDKRKDFMKYIDDIKRIGGIKI